MNSLKAYLASNIEQLKDAEEEYLRGYVEAHKDILAKIEKDEEFIREMGRKADKAMGEN